MLERVPFNRADLMAALDRGVREYSDTINTLRIGCSLYISRPGIGIVIKVVTDDQGYSGRWSAVRFFAVGLGGTIDTVVLTFDSVCVRTLVDPDVCATSSTKLHIWSDGRSEDWYIVEPESLSPVIIAMCQYIDIFQDSQRASAL